MTDVTCENCVSLAVCKWQRVTDAAASLLAETGVPVDKGGVALRWIVAAYCEHFDPSLAYGGPPVLVPVDADEDEPNEEE